MSKTNESMAELDRATRLVTAFDTYAQLVEHCRTGYVPTLPPPVQVPVQDELGRFAGMAFEEHAAEKELVRSRLLAHGLRVFPMPMYGGL